MAIKDVSVGKKKTANNDDTMREWMSRGKRGSPSRTFRLSAYRRLVQSKFGGPTGKNEVHSVFLQVPLGFRINI
jgi:hypothetical protein